MMNAFMARRGAAGRFGRAVCALLLVLLAGSGCVSRYQAVMAKYTGPRYVVTEHFYKEAPQRVAVLPFAAKTDAPVDVKKAEECRRIFYQHLCLRDFEDVEIRKFDRVISQSSTNEAGMLSQLVGLVRTLDVVGMTTVIDLDRFFQENEMPYDQFLELVRLARDDMEADAYIIGMTRDYGRLYAVLFSSIGISTRLELRSAVNGNLMWRGEKRKRNYELPLTLNPLDIPRLLYDVWENSRGLAVETLSYQLHGDIARTLPYKEKPGPAYVRITKNRTPLFTRPRTSMLLPLFRARKGDLFDFILEENGWILCRKTGHEESSKVWVFSYFTELVDQEGSVLQPYADISR